METPEEKAAVEYIGKNIKTYNLTADLMALLQYYPSPTGYIYTQVQKVLYEKISQINFDK